MLTRRYAAARLLLMLAACGPSCAADKAAPGKYVALGGSFAAGPMIPDPVPDQSCGRSTNNYPHLVAADLGLALTDASCIGATTADVGTTQIDAVTADASVITLTVGGNDVNFSSSLGTCGSDGKAGTSCLEVGDVDAAAIDGLLDQVEAKLVTMFDKVKQAAPAAHVYLVPYPMILPEPAAPCPPDVPMNAADATFLGHVATRLQAALSAAATTAGVTFIDVYGPSHGHDACAPADQRWVEGEATAAAAPYHPNAAGMRAEADLIVAELRKNAP
jgi:lysophospholipase L1-like esterase